MAVGAVQPAVADGRARRSPRSLSRSPLNASIVSQSVDGAMKAIKVQIERCIDASQYPAVVECTLVDAGGVAHRFVEKAPIVTGADLDAGSAYPQPGVIACAVLGVRQAASGQSVMEVDTEQPWHVESVEGLTRFEVDDAQIVDLTYPLEAG